MEQPTVATVTQAAGLMQRLTEDVVKRLRDILMEEPLSLSNVSSGTSKHHRAPVTNFVQGDTADALMPPTKSKVGDLAFVTFPFAKLAKQPPAHVAKVIAEKVNAHLAPLPLRVPPSLTTRFR